MSAVALWQNYKLLLQLLTLLAKLTKEEYSQITFANKFQSGANAANRERKVPKLEFPHHQSQTRTRLTAAAVTRFCNLVESLKKLDELERFHQPE